MGIVSARKRNVHNESIRIRPSTIDVKASRKDCKKYILEITSRGGVHWVIPRVKASL
jgi:hypothetical protein